MKIKILALLLLLGYIAQAQDTIVKKNGDLIRAKITEVGTSEIKFKIYGQEESPVITLDRNEVKTAIIGGQTIISVKEEVSEEKADVIVKKSGDQLKVKVMEIGTDEIKFKLFNNQDGPTISMLRTDIKSMKVDGQTVIDVKSGLTEDLITKKDGTIIKAKISELGDEEVKYKLYSSPDGPVMSIKKDDIENIKIDGQMAYEYKEDPLSVSNNQIQNRTSTAKFYFFSPLNQHIDFGYEWMNKPGFNWDVAIGIIGVGVSSPNSRNPKGVFLRGGPKFLLGSTADVVRKNTKEKFAHPLKGKYIKVEFILNAFSTTNSIDTNYYWPTPGGNTGKLVYTKKYQSFTLNLQYGRQYIFGNSMTMAWFMGVGYSFENATTNLDPKYKGYDYFDFRRYSHSYFGETFPMVFTWGLTVGYILPEPGWKAKKNNYTKPPTRRSMTN